MTTRSFFRAACAAALIIAAPAAVWAQGTAAVPAGSASKAQDEELQAAITKSNAYTALMNRTLRAIQS